MISIIVPIYNVEKYLNKCISSIVKQTFKDLEIILVDDGSPDSCPEICDSWAEKDSRIKVIHKKNGGLMSARQAGLKDAEGEYIGFVDGDDWIEPEMYAYFYNTVEKYHPDIAVSEFIYDYTDKQIVSQQNLSKPYFTKVQMIEELYPTMLYKAPYYNFGINPCCWSKLYKKELLKKCLFSVPVNVKIGEDTAFTYPCLLQAESLAYIDKPCYHYMDNPASMTSSYDPDMENTILIPYNILKQEFSVLDYDFSASLSGYSLYLFEFIIRNEASADNHKSKKEIKNTLRLFLNNEDFYASISNINPEYLSLRKKAVLCFFKIRSSELLYWYVKLLKKLRS